MYKTLQVMAQYLTLATSTVTMQACIPMGKYVDYASFHPELIWVTSLQGWLIPMTCIEANALFVQSFLE